MLRRTTALVLFALAITSLSEAAAEMGPCRAAAEKTMICGSGDGAASLIQNTTSPSKRLALAWRLTDRPPTYQPDEHDSHLENLIVRIDDGAVLAKTRGSYWHTGGRTAKANNIASWSPDSRYLIAGVERVDSESVELFWIAQDDRVTGPLDLVKVLEPAVRAQMGGIKNSDDYTFGITYKPGISIDDVGLIHASVYMAQRGSGEGPVYDLTAQVNRTAASADIEVLSVSEFHGLTGSVTVH